MLLALLGLPTAVPPVLSRPAAFALLDPSLAHMAAHRRSPPSAPRPVATAADSFPLLALPRFTFVAAPATNPPPAPRRRGRP